jgi:hypothetical protein
MEVPLPPCLSWSHITCLKNCPRCLYGVNITAYSENTWVSCAGLSILFHSLLLLFPDSEASTALAVLPQAESPDVPYPKSTHSVRPGDLIPSKTLTSSFMEPPFLSSINMLLYRVPPFLIYVFLLSFPIS